MGAGIGVAGTGDGGRRRGRAGHRCRADAPFITNTGPLCITGMGCGDTPEGNGLHRRRALHCVNAGAAILVYAHAVGRQSPPGSGSAPGGRRSGCRSCRRRCGDHGAAAHHAPPRRGLPMRRRESVATKASGLRWRRRAAARRTRREVGPLLTAIVRMAGRCRDREGYRRGRQVLRARGGGRDSGSREPHRAGALAPWCDTVPNRAMRKASVCAANWRPRRALCGRRARPRRKHVVAIPLRHRNRAVGTLT